MGAATFCLSNSITHILPTVFWAQPVVAAAAAVVIQTFSSEKSIIRPGQRGMLKWVYVDYRDCVEVFCMLL